MAAPAGITATMLSTVVRICYNDDEKSPYYCWYISYETPMTLQDKLDFIEQKGIAGLIVWECSQDTYDHAMISQMADNLLK